MQKSFTILMTGLLTLCSLNCYTIVKPLQLGNRAQYDRQYFNSELVLIPELLEDDWIEQRTETYNSDGWIEDVTADPCYDSAEEQSRDVRYTYIKQISFYTSGKVTFYSNSEVPAGIIHVGRYRPFADTLIVYFDDKSDIEKYLFQITNDSLKLKGIWKYDYATYTLIEKDSLTYTRFRSL